MQDVLDFASLGTPGGLDTARRSLIYKQLISRDELREVEMSKLRARNAELEERIKSFIRDSKPDNGDVELRILPVRQDSNDKMIARLEANVINLTRERDAHALDAAEARGIFQSRTDRIAELKVLCYTYEDQISERTRQLDQCHKQLEAHGELSQFFSTTQEKLAAEIEALRSEFSLLQVRFDKAKQLQESALVANDALSAIIGKADADIQVQRVQIQQLEGTVQRLQEQLAAGATKWQHATAEIKQLSSASEVATQFALKSQGQREALASEIATVGRACSDLATKLDEKEAIIATLTAQLQTMAPGELVGNLSREHVDESCPHLAGLLDMRGQMSELAAMKEIADKQIVQSEIRLQALFAEVAAAEDLKQQLQVTTQQLSAAQASIMEREATIRTLSRIAQPAPLQQTSSPELAPPVQGVTDTHGPVQITATRDFLIESAGKVDDVDDPDLWWAAEASERVPPAANQNRPPLTKSSPRGARSCHSASTAPTASSHKPAPKVLKSNRLRVPPSFDDEGFIHVSADGSVPTSHRALYRPPQSRASPSSAPNTATRPKRKNPDNKFMDPDPALVAPPPKRRAPQPTTKPIATMYSQMLAKTKDRG